MSIYSKRFQLLKIAQKCGAIEKFDMIFHKSGPQFGQPRGYAFVTFVEVTHSFTYPTKNDACSRYFFEQIFSQAQH